MFVGRYVPQIVLAAFGDEVRLGDDGDPGVHQVGDHIVGHDRGVFDAVAEVAARRAQRCQRDNKLGVGDAVQRDGHIMVVLIGHPSGEPVDVEPVVVQDPLARSEEVKSLRDLASPVRHR